MSPFETGESHFLKPGGGGREGGNMKSCGVAERLLVSTERFGKPQAPRRWSRGAWNKGCWVCPCCFLQEDLETRCKLQLSYLTCPLQLDPSAFSDRTRSDLSDNAPTVTLLIKSPCTAVRCVITVRPDSSNHSRD